jgi:uncharacterized protein
VNKMNPVVHFEMPAENKERIADFYTKVFGWQTRTLGPEMGGYVLVTTIATDDNGIPKKPGAINGGFYEKSEEIPAQHPSLVIEVDDLEEAMQKVKQTSGQIIGQPQNIPGTGSFVYFTDTEGNIIGMMQPAAMG